MHPPSASVQNDSQPCDDSSDTYGAAWCSTLVTHAQRSLCTLLGFALLTTGCTDSVVAQRDRSLPVEVATQLLVLDNGAGELIIEGEDRSDIFVEVQLRGPRRGDPNQHRSIADRIEIRVETVDDTTQRLVASLPEAPRGYSIDVHAHVPQELAMDVGDGSGDLVIDGVGALTLSDGSGDSVLRNIGGELWVDDGSGDLSIGGVAGNVEVTDDSGDLSITDAGADVEVRDGSGDIGMKNIVGVVTIEDGSGDIGVVNAGDVKVLRDTSGDVGIR